MGVVALVVVAALKKNPALSADVVATYRTAGIAILVVIALKTNRKRMNVFQTIGRKIMNITGRYHT